MIRCILQDFDTPHQYTVLYPVYLLKETETDYKIWHWFKFPFGKWISKNTMDYKLHKPEE